ncbi:MAG: glutathione S-transferase family protein [Steroidobacteraceae bacterium]|nr:glutathione S-transferase family protein [Steroidobacteraceae bacterium]MDW8259687.1 glutathione S-transferase family protein [Gammaproteobacteria bacterium]
MIELHTTATANGYKASIMLEEVGLPYRVVAYDLTRGEHLQPAYLELNPVGRLPLIVDDCDGERISVYGTAAIVLYVAEKTGRLLPAAPAARAKVYEWLGIVASDIAPAYSGQFVFNVLLPEKIPAAIDYFDKLCLRLLAAMETQLGRSAYLAGSEYTIADVLAYPVAATSMRRFPGDFSAHPHIGRWASQVGARPAVERGMRVPAPSS